MRFTDGAFCFYRVSGTCKPMTPTEIEQLARQHGIRESIYPTYAGDRQTVSRALSQVSAHLGRQGWMLDAIKTAKHEVVYAIVEKQKDQAREHIDYSQCSKLRWSDEHGNGAHVDGSHEIAQRVDTAYQELRGKIVAGDWTESLVEYLRTDCYAQSMLTSGYVYWIAPQYLDVVKQLQPFLEHVGISLVLCEVETESKNVVEQAAQEGLADQLAALQTEIDAFSGEEKPTTFRLRIERLQALRKRATVYHSTLGIAVEQAQAMIDQLEHKAQTMLDIREDMVVHRDGSSEHTSPLPTPTRSSSSSKKESAQSFEAYAASRPACQPLDTIDTPGTTPQAWIQTGFSW
jgi:hypothetical protein